MLLLSLARLLSFNALLGTACAAEYAFGPHAVVQQTALGDASWTSGFWADWSKNARTQIIPTMQRLMEGTEYTQFLRNFEIAAGLAEGSSRGAPFNDGDFYKWMEAASATLSVESNPDLERRLDEIIDIIGKAQRDDGYIHTKVLIKQRNGDTSVFPFQDRHNFEMYNMGHLLTAASVHYRVTGKTNLLTIARKSADFLYRTFNQASPDAARSSVCPAHYMGMIDLYRTTGEQRYLELAQRFFELRSQITDGGDDNQDRIPFKEQNVAMGHAVRANYLYAGATDLYMETGDNSLWKPLESIWKDLISRKMYITGGCGALYDGASPDGSKNQGSITRTHQAYGRNYQLPNTTAHSETCANIGNVLRNWRMFLATGHGCYVDVAERALYNSVLSGVSLNVTEFFYTNPLRVTDPMPTELRWSRTRVPFISSFCCPPNLARILAQTSIYAYSTSDDSIWLNLYGGSSFKTTLRDGNAVKLNQETEYPWNGRIRISLEECSGDPFAIKLRIPEWAERYSIQVNHQLIKDPVVNDGYLKLERSWNPGDIIDLDLPMEVRLIEANPLVEETLNQLAVMRGPIVYCLETPDLPDDINILDMSIAEEEPLLPRFDFQILGGVVVIETRLYSKPTDGWDDQLYREYKAPQSKQIKTRFIPYYAWGNRGPSEMSVWLPRF